MPNISDKSIAQYQVGREVGRGAMGTVYIANDPVAKIWVAIKSMKKKKHSRRALLHEVAIMKNLAHENVVQMVTVMESKQDLLIVLEYVGGGELFDKVSKWKRDTRERLTFHYFHQLMTGLKYLHNQGYAHRDLKLENLLVSKDGILKIADFGVSKELSFNPMKTCCGSPDYIAPEILMDQSGYDGKLADIWSCAVILYAMLCGEFPFEKTEHILEGKYKPPKWFPKLAQDSCLNKMFVVNPAKRLQTADEVMGTEWFMSFKAQRNSLGILLDTVRQVKHKSDRRIKIRGLLLFRSISVRVLVQIKIIHSLASPSIKGIPRDIVAVSQDRLKFVLRLVSTFTRTTAGSVRIQTGSTHEVDWKALGNSSDYQRHMRLFAEVQRANLAKLSEDAKICVFINIWHVMVIHGYVTKGEHLCSMSKADRKSFFEDTCYVVGYVNLSLNDIKHGILRANRKRPGFLVSKCQIDSVLQPDKLAVICSKHLPMVHSVLSTFTCDSPTVSVYSVETLYEDLAATTAKFINQQVVFSKQERTMTFPNCFKKYWFDLGPTQVESTQWVVEFLDEAQGAQLQAMVASKGSPSIKYPERQAGFTWTKQDVFQKWDESEKYRFQTSVEQRVQEWKEAGAKKKILHVNMGMKFDGSFKVEAESDGSSSKRWLETSDGSFKVVKMSNMSPHGSFRGSAGEVGWGDSSGSMSGSMKKKDKKRVEAVIEEGGEGDGGMEAVDEESGRGDESDGGAIKKKKKEKKEKKEKKSKKSKKSKEGEDGREGEESAGGGMEESLKKKKKKKKKKEEGEEEEMPGSEGQQEERSDPNESASCSRGGDHESSVNMSLAEPEADAASGGGEKAILEVVSPSERADEAADKEADGVEGHDAEEQKKPLKKVKKKSSKKDVTEGEATPEKPKKKKKSNKVAPSDGTEGEATAAPGSSTPKKKKGKTSQSNRVQSDDSPLVAASGFDVGGRVRLLNKDNDSAVDIDAAPDIAELDGMDVQVADPTYQLDSLPMGAHQVDSLNSDEGKNTPVVLRASNGAAMRLRPDGLQGLPSPMRSAQASPMGGVPSIGAASPRFGATSPRFGAKSPMPAAARSPMLVGMGRPPVVPKSPVASAASKEGGTDGGLTPGGESANPAPEGTLASTANQGSSKLLNTSKPQVKQPEIKVRYSQKKNGSNKECNVQ